MLQFKNTENRKNITYELACNEGKLTSKDKKILNLAKKIEKDASVVKELKKLDKIEEILMVEIVRKCKGRKERLTLLQQALLYSHNATLEYVIKRAEEYKLFEKISGKRIVSEHLGDHGEPINRTYSTVVCENGAVHRKTLTPRGKTPNNGTIIAEDKNNEKVPDLITINQGTAAVGILTETEPCESSEGSKNFSKETAIEESRACDMQEDIGEVVDDYRNNFDFKEQKVTETGTQSYEDINKNNKDFHLTFENKERAETEVPLRKEKMVSTQRLIPLDPVLLDDEYIGNVNLTMIEHAEEKAMSTRRLIKVDRSLLDNEDNKDFQLTFENTKKAQNSSIENAVQGRNISGSFPFRKCFNSDAGGKEENPSTKAIQQKRAILAGSAGVVLLVGSVASYIMKMHVIAVIGGIVGLACIGFALYKPNTKFEKVKGVEQASVFFGSNIT